MPCSPPHSPGRSGDAGSLLLSLLWILCSLYFLAVQVHAADRTNVPLRNWGGFAINRHWTYDAIEKLVLAGFADRAVLNTKPMSRLEMAKIVAQAVKKITEGEGELYNERQDMEDVLYRLVEEFQPELADLGVEAALQRGEPHKFFFLKVVDHVQARAAFAKDDALLENNQGDFLRKGVSGRLAALSKAQVGDFFSVSLLPEVRFDKTDVVGRLLEGSAKLTGWGVEVQAGRESLWWGPGFHGSMLFSNNPQPFDLIKLGSAEAFTLPSIFKYLGPIKATFVLGQLEEHRDIPNTKLAGLRLDLAPTSFLELGFGRAVQFDGRGRSLRVLDYPRAIFTAGSDVPSSPLQTNSLLSADLTLRLRNLDRYLPLFKDLEFYGELGWDDTCCNDIYVPLRPGGIVGIYAPNLFGSSQTELRVEFAATSNIQFTHFLYITGYSFQGRPIAHFIGTKGSDFYVRIARWLRPDLLLGLQFDDARIGPVANGTLDFPRERRLSIGPDLSYRFSKALSFFGATQLSSSDNLGFVPNRDKKNFLLRLEATYSF